MCVLLSRLILYYACCYLMTSSVSTLVNLWNTEYIIIIIILLFGGFTQFHETVIHYVCDD